MHMAVDARWVPILDNENSLLLNLVYTLELVWYMKMKIVMYLSLLIDLG